MLAPFSSDDLGRMFDARTLTRGRSLVLLGAVQVRASEDSITATVEERGVRRTATLVPAVRAHRVVFDSHCTCQTRACVHLAATAFAALDRYPALRRVEQKSFLGGLSETSRAEAAPERRRLVYDVAAGAAPHACFVSPLWVGERSGRSEATTPRRIAAEAEAETPGAGGTGVSGMGVSGTDRAIAALLGGGEALRTGVPPARLAELLTALVRSGQGRWSGTGRRLVAGEERSFQANVPPRLPPKSAVLLGSTGPWYVDGSSGAVGKVKLRQTRARAPVVQPRARRAEPVMVRAAASEQVIVERDATPVLQLSRLECPDDYGKMQQIDALTLDFDYGDVRVGGGDERQFVRVAEAAGPAFVRRDTAAETAAFELLRQDGFVQMRVADGGNAKGRRVLVFRGQDPGEFWHRFVALRVPALQALGWVSLIDRDFGPRLATTVGKCDVAVSDVLGSDGAADGFSLDFGIEIDGERQPLLPILRRILDRGGLEMAQVVGEDVITSTLDGRVLKLPLERIRPLLAIMADLIDQPGTAEDTLLVLPSGEATVVLELEDLLATRWENAAAIEAYAERFRGEPEILPVVVPAAFTASLRPYQQHGVEWLQHLASHRLSGFLADEMGLGKTAQTIAHLVVEQAAGRLDRPALIVVPTSLIANWVAELGKFAPRLRVAVLHGLDRHQRRGQLDTFDVVITTYTVLARDVEAMRELSWHIVVLDEAQAIKSPDAKATRAVCQLQTRQRLCLSGTPIENNLEELWSQFAFLMPGLLGDRRGFTRRFRTPIEKRGDDQRRVQLIRRIRPFILRRTKSEVATDLPPKHTILRRVTLAPEQREIYETIRGTLQEKVRAQITENSLARSRIVVLDALLKLRQACCDPRLVKLPSAQLVEVSSKLDTLMEMVGEMVPEGRRILLFSQFTSMLDLIKPRLVEAGIAFVELRGSTHDRGEPVRAFQAGEVPVFLISLKAGGRGLNLTAADTVIHYDPWWNPAVEDQASDRAHRLGQTKSVFVYKLIAADTVEERILELQQRKAELAGIAFDETSDLGGLGVDDVDFLFAGPLEQAA